MAKATEYSGTQKTFIKITMGPKEAQSLRNLLGRVKKGSDSATARNLDSIRSALNDLDFGVDGTLSGVNAGTVSV